jgi:hypothetical protein
VTVGAFHCNPQPARASMLLYQFWFFDNAGNLLTPTNFATVFFARRMIFGDWNPHAASSIGAVPRGSCEKYLRCDYSASVMKLP